MLIERIFQERPDCADASETVRVAAQRMGARGVGTLVVVDGDGRPAGILTDRDVAVRVAGRGLDPNRTTVFEAMTDSPLSVERTTTVERALAIMQEGGVRRLLVVAPDGRLVGIVSLDDVLKQVASTLGAVGDVLARCLPGAATNAG